MSSRTVTVLGLGWMGAAIANTMIREGHGVTVWNRILEKSATFAGGLKSLRRCSPQLNRATSSSCAS